VHLVGLGLPSSSSVIERGRRKKKRKPHPSLSPLDGRKEGGEGMQSVRTLQERREGGQKRTGDAGLCTSALCCGCVGSGGVDARCVENRHRGQQGSLQTLASERYLLVPTGAGCLFTRCASLLARRTLATHSFSPGLLCELGSGPVVASCCATRVHKSPARTLSLSLFHSLITISFLSVFHRETTFPFFSLFHSSTTSFYTPST
jgi:hypothetical protein